MGPISGTVVYLIVWWVVIFAVLPFGVRQPDVPDHSAGAPRDPNIRKKFIITTLISAVIWVIIYILIDIKFVDFRHMAASMPIE